MAESEFHPKFPTFKQVSTIDVDAGSIWVGDGCYVLKDKDEARPKDLGDDWHGICERFFERSGYEARQREYQAYRWKVQEEALFKNKELMAFFETREHTKEEEEAQRVAIRAAEDAWMAANPFVPTSEDTGVASFNHDMGHGGMGCMISTNYGDGSYPVYIEYANGRPSRVLIDFYGDESMSDEEEDEIEETPAQAAE